jgi:hypothetical protein
MTDSDELISKADALLARWRSGAVVPRPPADYPVLTEVVKITAADRDTPTPEIPAEPDMPVLDASSAAAGESAPMEIPVLDSPDALALDAPSILAAADTAPAMIEAADELPHLPPMEESPAAANAGLQALEEHVRLRVLEAIEPLVAAFLEEPLRLRIEELAKRLATTIARDAREEILTLVRDAVRRAAAHEFEARRDD